MYNSPSISCSRSPSPPTSMGGRPKNQENDAMLDIMKKKSKMLEGFISSCSDVLNSFNSNLPITLTASRLGPWQNWDHAELFTLATIHEIKRKLALNPNSKVSCSRPDLLTFPLNTDHFKNKIILVTDRSLLSTVTKR